MSDVLKTCEFMQEVDAAVHEYLGSAAVFSSYIVTGGALRDTLLGRPVKDIDIVVERREPWNCTWSDDEYGPTGAFAVADPDITVRGLPVQLIHRDGDLSVRAMMQYHSMGVSNVFWVNGALVLDPVWCKDVADRKHTVNRTRWGGVGDEVNKERLQQYIDKIVDKYPWPLRDV